MIEETRNLHAPAAVLFVVAILLTTGFGFGFLRAKTGENADLVSTGWIQAVSSAASAAMSLFVVATLWQTGEQLKTTRHWNKMNATFTYFQTSDYLRVVQEAIDGLRCVGIDLPRIPIAPIESSQLSRLLNNMSAFDATKALLDYLEHFAVAVHEGVIDSPTAYRMISAPVLKYTTVLYPFIRVRREDIGDPEIYKELQNLALAWCQNETANVWAKCRSVLADADHKWQ